MAKNDEKKKMHPLLTFIFVILLPSTLALLLAIIILSIAGVNVVGWMKDKASNVPVLSAVVSSDNSEGKNNTEYDRIISLKDDEIAKQVTEINQLNSQIDDLETKISKLEKQKKLLEKNSKVTKIEVNEHEVDEEVKKAASSFRKMDPAKAAAIISDLKQNTAITILENLSGDVRGEILGEMEPKEAAKLMEAMIN